MRVKTIAIIILISIANLSFANNSEEYYAKKVDPYLIEARYYQEKGDTYMQNASYYINKAKNYQREVNNHVKNRNIDKTKTYVS